MKRNATISLKEYQRHNKEIAPYIEDAVNLLVEQLIDTLASRNRIEVRGFGALSLREYKTERKYHHPKKLIFMKTITKPFFRFKASKALKKSLNIEQS